VGRLLFGGESKELLGEGIKSVERKNFGGET